MGRAALRRVCFSTPSIRGVLKHTLHLRNNSLGYFDGCQAIVTTDHRHAFGLDAVDESFQLGPNLIDILHFQRIEASPDQVKFLASPPGAIPPRLIE